MAARPQRVEILEQKVEGLQKLPARMDAVKSQILQLRDEMRDEFSAIRKRFEETKQLAQELHQEVLTRLHEGDQENGRLMRVLHEDVVARISLLGESRGRRKR